MTKMIAETAWHHEGDFTFMHELVSKICTETSTDIVKMHITLDLDEYMSQDHDAYDVLKSWMLTEKQWDDLIKIVQSNGKELLLLLNDTKAIKFASKYKPELVELHSVCLNVPKLQKSIIDNIHKESKVVIGLGGCTLDEIDSAMGIFKNRDIVLMFGFQNYPTKYADVNLKKIRKIQSLYPNNLFGYADHTGWDEINNELISLLVAANGMDYVEKHVTIKYGEERCDFSAAISIDMFNKLSEKIKVVDELNGNGSILLNSAEKSYSQYGPMKMAAIMKRKLVSGDKLSKDDFMFCRTKQQTAMSQIDVMNIIGSEVKKNIAKGQVIDSEYFGG